MFVLTAKMSKKGIAAVIFAAVALIAVIFITIFTRGVSETAYNGDAALAAAMEKRSVGAATNDDRRAFLAWYGWETEPDAREFYEVTIPKEFDRVYTRYNELQKQQEFDLKKYRGKAVTKYSYRVTNYPGYEGDVYATLLVWRDKVIGGDIASAALDGFMHGFARPEIVTDTAAVSRD